ncbi:MAG TPA: RNA polymerase sigma factor [Gemmatimonadales bacterium]
MRGGTQPADGEVVRRVLAGEAELFRVLVERYREEFGRFASSLTGDPDSAADAMQEAFIRAYTSLASCRDPERFKHWFFRILTNRCHTVRSRRKQEVPLEGPEPASAARTDARVEQNELRDILARALDTLTEEQRTAFVLKEVEGYGYDEMSRILGVGVDALKMRVYRARDALRARLRESA